MHYTSNETRLSQKCFLKYFLAPVYDNHFLLLSHHCITPTHRFALTSKHSLVFLALSCCVPTLLCFEFLGKMFATLLDALLCICKPACAHNLNHASLHIVYASVLPYVTSKLASTKFCLWALGVLYNALGCPGPPRFALSPRVADYARQQSKSEVKRQRKLCFKSGAVLM